MARGTARPSSAAARVMSSDGAASSRGRFFVGFFVFLGAGDAHDVARVSSRSEGGLDAWTHRERLGAATRCGGCVR